MLETCLQRVLAHAIALHLHAVIDQRVFLILVLKLFHAHFVLTARLSRDGILVGCAVFFPEIDFTQYVISSKEKGIKDEKNPYDYEYIIYDKIK